MKMRIRFIYQDWVYIDKYDDLYRNYLEQGFYLTLFKNEYVLIKSKSDLKFPFGIPKSSIKNFSDKKKVSGKRTSRKRASGKLAFGNKIVNPRTGRLITVGGKIYNDLLDEGIINDRLDEGVK